MNIFNLSVNRIDWRIKQSEREKNRTYSVILYECLRVIQDSKKKSNRIVWVHVLSRNMVYEKREKGFYYCIIFYPCTHRWHSFIFLSFLQYMVKRNAFLDKYICTWTMSIIFSYPSSSVCPFLHSEILLLLFFSSSQTTTNRADVVGVEREIWVSDERADERKKRGEKSSLAIITHR